MATGSSRYLPRGAFPAACPVQRSQPAPPVVSSTSLLAPQLTAEPRLHVAASPAAHSRAPATRRCLPRSSQPSFGYTSLLAPQLTAEPQLYTSLPAPQLSAEPQLRISVRTSPLILGTSAPHSLFCQCPSFSGWCSQLHVPQLPVFMATRPPRCLPHGGILCCPVQRAICWCSQRPVPWLEPAQDGQQRMPPRGKYQDGRYPLEREAPGRAAENATKCQAAGRVAEYATIA